MKIHQRKGFYGLVILLIGLTACTSTSFTESTNEHSEDYISSLLLERGTTPITAEQAINVVKLFDFNNCIITKSDTDIISDVYTHLTKKVRPCFML